MDGTGTNTDSIRIMLATDNHIGYLERDPVRGQDSINTFKEILQLARKYDVTCFSTGLKPDELLDQFDSEFLGSF